jgi:hypothetical protein
MRHFLRLEELYVVPRHKMAAVPYDEKPLRTFKDHIDDDVAK